MKFIKYPALLTASIFLVFLSSCRKGEQEIDREAGKRLFEISESLIKTYSDSIELASDTTALLRAEKSLTEKMAKVNFQFPPNTDITLTEEENDSLAHMLKRFREKYDLRLKDMIRKLPPDSVSPALSSPSAVSVSENPHPAVSTVGVDSIAEVSGD